MPELVDERIFPFASLKPESLQRQKRVPLTQNPNLGSWIRAVPKLEAIFIVATVEFKISVKSYWVSGGNNSSESTPRIPEVP